MDWYDTFNTVEAALWGVVAGVILRRTPCSSRQQRAAVSVAAGAFAVFGLTDLLEIGRAGTIPWWLWTAKIICGCTILAARYTWRGWNTFRFRDREFLFGLGCLVAVGVVIAMQNRVQARTSTGSM
jgi:hypothetical protein